MADRTIRDELLESDRWLDPSLSNDDRTCWLACALTADALGNMEGGAGRLRRLWLAYGVDTPEQVEQVIAHLCAVDLLRVYEVDGKKLIHIPRYRQHLRYIKRVHPISPWTTDEEKQRITENSHGEHTVSTRSAPREHHVRTVEVKRSEVKNFKNRAHAPDPVDNFSPAHRTPAPEPRAKGSPNVKGNGQSPSSATARAPPDWRRNATSAAAYGATLGAAPMPGEGLPAYVARLDRLLAMLGPGQRPRRAEKVP